MSIISSFLNELLNNITHSYNLILYVWVIKNINLSNIIDTKFTILQKMGGEEILMINIILKWIIYAALIIFIAWIIPGISVESFGSALLVCIVIGIINSLIKPFVEFISLPVNFLTLGLFSFVINALLLMLAGSITPGFEVKGFFSALLGSILLATFGNFVDKIDK